MTAEVIRLFPTGEDADETVRRSIKALMAAQGLTKEDVAPRAGMAVSTLYRRFTGKGSEQAFKAGEVASIAAVLGVDISVLYGGLGGSVVPPQPPRGGEGLSGTHGYLLTLAA